MKNIVDLDGKVDSKNGFFAVNSEVWERVCRHGSMLDAAAYLILARGSDSTNRKTKWSARSVAERGGVRKEHAKAAIGRLETNGYIKTIRGGGKPLYEFEIRDEEADLIWLPNALIDGAADEVTPLRLIKQSGSLAALHIFIRLYCHNDLPGCGGVDFGILSVGFERRRLWDSAELVTWGFNDTDMMSCKVMMAPYSDEEFRQTINLLERLGLFEWVPIAFSSTGDEAEMLFPVSKDAGQILEREVAGAAWNAAFELLPLHWRAAESYAHWVTAYSSQPNIAVIGIARLRYLPWTNMTAGWFAGLHDLRDREVVRFEQLSQRHKLAA